MLLGIEPVGAAAAAKPDWPSQSAVADALGAPYAEGVGVALGGAAVEPGGGGVDREGVDASAVGAAATGGEEQHGDECAGIGPPAPCRAPR